MNVPRIRLRAQGDIRPDGAWVLYWMIAARRPRWNFALDRAVELAIELDRPLVVLEALRCGHRWASERTHRFVLDGMRDNADAFEGTGVLHHPYVEPRAGAGRGLLERLMEDACAVVTDEFPTFFLPRMVAAAAGRCPVRFEVVDGNGLLPLRATDRALSRAYDFRRVLHRILPEHLGEAPRPRPLAGRRPPALDALPAEIERRWPRADDDIDMSSLPIDHAIAPVDIRGGAAAGRKTLKSFLDERLTDYGEFGASSGLSPYLHFGHVSTHEVLDTLADHEDWMPERLRKPTGKSEGWWNMSSAAESFLDELVTWRELGYHFAHHEPDHDRYETLPGWAQETLGEHAGDERPYVYDLDAFRDAATHDELWNAMQRQLRVEGTIPNQLRMLWGKKILHWSKSPRDALDVMVELNNSYAVDGRDPNSYSGIFWVLGRFDRAWGPERPVFGKVRYMTSDSARRKYRLSDYIGRWSA